MTPIVVFHKCQKHHEKNLYKYHFEARQYLQKAVKRTFHDIL